MPQSANNHVRSAPIQIAQGESSPPAAVPEKPVAGTTREAPAEKHAAGEVPDAHLLFYNSILVALVMVAFALAARRRLADIPKGFANFAEFVGEAINYFTVGIIGEGGEKYTPLVGTVFVYILLSNLLGLIPGLHSPTSNLTITLALGVIVFVYVQYQGIRNLGLGGYLKHFMGPMPAMAPLIMPVELISEIIKPFTLAVRLFGNIFGEDVIIIVLAGLGAGSVATMWLPIHWPILFLAVLTSVVQAMVFAILTCIYISLMSHHDHSDHGKEGAVTSHAAHPAGH